jgi:putative transposase
VGTFRLARFSLQWGMPVGNASGDVSGVPVGTFRLARFSLYDIIIQGDKMARQARKISESGIYHIILRGIDYRNIFLEENDFIKFKEYLQKAKTKHKAKLYSYVLMTNHVHLLIEIIDIPIGDFVKSITVGYVQYHNKKYGRTGHLFQNRFLSEAVENDSYLMTVQRYIHQNPLKAGMVDKIKEYKWSSYGEYLNRKEELCSTGFLIDVFDNYESFIKYNIEKDDTKVMEYTPAVTITDKELRDTIEDRFNINKILKGTKSERDDEIRLIKKEIGLSNRKLGRVLGIGRNIINRIK